MVGPPTSLSIVISLPVINSFGTNYRTDCNNLMLIELVVRTSWKLCICLGNERYSIHEYYSLRDAYQVYFL